MSFNTNGFSSPSLTASNIPNFTSDVIGVIQNYNSIPGNAGLTQITTSGSNLGGKGQVGNPLYLTDLITVTDVHTNNLSASGNTLALTVTASAISSSQILSTFAGNASGLTNITASGISNFTADVRTQFSAGTNINITNGIVSTVDVATNSQISSSITGALLPYATLTGVSGTFTTPAQVSASITGALLPYATLSGVSASFTTPSQVSSSVTGALTPYATLTGVSGTFTTPSQVSSSITGALIPYALLSGSLITGSFSGSAAGLYNLTASGIANFTADVRRQISGSQYASYNSSTGIISLPYTGSLIGTSPIVLGQTASVLTGLTSISASNITASYVTASVVVTNIFVTGSTALGANLQILTGSNRPAGVVTLSTAQSIADVTCSLVTPSSLIYITKQTGNKNNGVPYIALKQNGSFRIQSNLNNDNDQVAYLIINPI